MSGHKQWAIGEEVLASDFAPYVTDQVAAQFASSAARASGWPTPPNGALTVLTPASELHGIYVWNGTSWRLPWNVPWGIVAMNRTTNGQGSITTTPTDITGMNVTFTAVANRRYKTTGKLEVNSTVANDIPVVNLTDGTTNLDRVTKPVTTAGETWNHSYIEVGTLSGSITRKYNIVRAAGSGILTITGGSVASIVVEDVGPIIAGAPS